MREIRLYGSEGGEATTSPTPITLNRMDARLRISGMTNNREHICKYYFEMVK